MLQEFINGPLAEKQKYYLLLALVCLKLPYYAVDNAIREGYGKEYRNATNRLTQVKAGRIADIKDLCALVKYSMPDFDIPRRLLPLGEFVLS